MNTPEDQVLPATVQPVNDDTGLLRLQTMDDIDSMIPLRLDGGKTLTLKASEALLTTYLQSGDSVEVVIQKAEAPQSGQWSRLTFRMVA